MTILKIMCGPPGAGKSYYVKTHAKPEDLVVSRDAIRYALTSAGIPYFSKEAEVFNEFCNQINDGIGKYDYIWADATHLNNTSRWKLLYNINRFSLEKIIFVCVERSLDDCLRQNGQRTGLANVPSGALQKMYHSYRRPSVNDFLSLNVEIEVIK